MSKSFAFRQSLIATVVASAFGVALMPSIALASEADIMKKIEAMEAEIKALKAEMAKQPTAAPAMAPQSGGKAVVVSATDGISIYGRLELVGTSNSDGKDSRTVLQNISSRIGIAGERKFTADLSGIMQVETGIAPDEGDTYSKPFASRNSFVGLKSQAVGSFIMGKYDMPLKKLEGYANPGYGELDVQEVVIHGKGTQRAAGATWNNLHTRQTNVLQYWSPKFAESFTVRAAYSPGGLDPNGENLPTTTTNYKKPVWGASVEFDNGKYQAGLATEKQQNYTANGKDMTGLKATAGMKLGAASFGLTYSALDNNDGKKTDNWLIGGDYKLSDAWKLKAEYATSSETAGGKNDGLTMWGLEADYLLDRNTTLFGYYANIRNEANAQGRFAAGDNTYTPLKGNDPKVFGLGIRYNF